MQNRNEKVSLGSVKEAGKMAGPNDEFRFQVRKELLEVWFFWKKVKTDYTIGTEVCEHCLASPTRIVRNRQGKRAEQR